MARVTLPVSSFPRAPRRGFILIIVVGMLAVLAILGFSFAEQGRVELMGARNSIDVSTADRLADAGFEIGLRALADDRNVPSAYNAFSGEGAGWTSRWAYNPAVGTGAAGGGSMGTDPAPSRGDARTFCESWQSVFWDDQDMGAHEAFGYVFQFDPADPNSRVVQRHPVDDRVMMDIWQRQPLMRVKRFRVRSGNTFGRIQIAICPRDGGINLNDVFEPGTITEYPGVYEQKVDPVPTQAANTNVPYASPDRRTLEYVLGKRPEWVNLGPELTAENPLTGRNDGDTWQLEFAKRQVYANLPHGNLLRDDGVYNFRRYFEPFGLQVTPGRMKTYHAQGYITSAPLTEPVIFYNANPSYPNRYNYEATRYALWTSPTPMSMRFDPVIGILAENLYGGARVRWWPSGRFRSNSITSGDPYSGGSTPQRGEVQCLFTGFGFDMVNRLRGAVGSATGHGSDAAACNPHVWIVNPTSSLPFSEEKYIGAGNYGHSKPQSFQRQYLAYALNGRFWSDLHANWYFGGAPGYTNSLGSSMDTHYQTSAGNWAHLGSSYDSAGIGSNWQTPTTHVWKAGYKSKGDLNTLDTDRGMHAYHGNMPPAKPAATYAYPLKKWGDDPHIANVQFLFNDARISLRACGVQENWGLFGADDPKGRLYDAINVNVTNFQAVYGLLTPEKIPSMMQRTVVAPHLHWKARMLDGAYKGMETFARYNPQTTPDALREYALDQTTASAQIPTLVDPPGGARDYRYGRLTDRYLPYHPATNPVIPLGASGNAADPDPNLELPATAHADSYIGPSYYNCSLHRAYFDPSNMNPLNDPATLAARRSAGTLGILGKMDCLTPDPATGMPADDVYTGVNYDLALYVTQNFDKNVHSHGLSGSTLVCRPNKQRNWADWFMQRLRPIPSARGSGDYRPNNNTVGFAKDEIIRPDVTLTVDAHTYPEGRVPSLSAAGTDSPRNFAAKHHPVHGVPNPDYLLMHPGSYINPHWSDQYRAYYPVYWVYGSDPPNAPLPNPIKADGDGWVPAGGPPPGLRLQDPYDATDAPLVNPSVPVAKVVGGSSNTQEMTPAVGKDEAWRLTRIGRKYQEIIADEIMDYQMNPWWPNPCVHGLSRNENVGEIATALSKTAYKVSTRDSTKVVGRLLSPPWWSYLERASQSSIEYQIPDYYAYFNRFWVRAAGRYEAGNRAWAQAHKFKTKWNDICNQVENPGIYPQAEQYFGQYPLYDHLFQDAVHDFPYNTLEDQSGAEWRYLSGTVKAMSEPSARSAPARNHPFRHWADFVGFLGHLVYRSPIAAAKRDARRGVEAADVCPSTFFDGSSISKADSLQEPIVARAGYWPLSANYGEWTKSGDGYPAAPSPWSNAAEWKRRLDEWRGRDAAGLRVEHHYISEAAANDVLVSFSNGNVRPIDFDGDGHITMTRKSELADDAPGQANYCWQGFPWHSLSGNATYGSVSVQHRTLQPDNLGHNNPVWKGGWSTTDRSEVLQGCVTLPIKFRSNTFRVSVLVELTDPTYSNVHTVRRYARVYSREPGAPAGNNKVHGAYTGMFIQHSSRVMTGVDPEMSWLGTK